jgi:rifampicin phosphotransferase
MNERFVHSLQSVWRSNVTGTSSGCVHFVTKFNYVVQLDYCEVPKHYLEPDRSGLLRLKVGRRMVVGPNGSIWFPHMTRPAPTRWIPDQKFDARNSFWTRANAGEVIPNPPSPASWDLLFDNGGSLAGWRDCGVNRLGFDADEVHEENNEMAGLIGGYFYLGATMTRVWAERTPGMSAAIVDAVYYGDHPDVPPYVAEPWHQNERTTQKMTQWLGWVMGSMDQTELQADRQLAYDFRNARPDLLKLSDLELVEYAASVRPLCRRLFDQHINQTGAASIGPGALGAICAAVGRPQDTLGLMSGLGGVDSAAPTYAMWDLGRIVRSAPALNEMFNSGPAGLYAKITASSDASAKDFVARLDTFLTEWGSRGPNEWDLMADTWETNPDLLLALIDRMRLLPDSSSPALQTSARETDRARLSAEIGAMIAGDPEASGTFAAALASSSTFVPGRERSKTNIIRVIGEARVAMRELGRRLKDRGDIDNVLDVCLLFEDELRAVASGSLTNVRALSAERKAYHQWLETLEPPFIINGTIPPIETWAKKSAHVATVAKVGEVLQGMPGCSGVIRGRACVVLSPSDPTALEDGDILIAPVTDPAWTPLFVPARGVVVNVGAALSHAIIVSRELGIPCVVSVNDATARIPQGAIIEVNGDTGTVTIISVP